MEKNEDKCLVPVSLFKELSGPMNSTFVTTTGYGIEH